MNSAKKTVTSCGWLTYNEWNEIWEQNRGEYKRDVNEMRKRKREADMKEENNIKNLGEREKTWRKLVKEEMERKVGKRDKRN